MNRSFPRHTTTGRQEPTQGEINMARIRIDDLPVAEDLTPEQEALLLGAGLRSFRPSLESLETREVPAVTASLGANGVLAITGDDTKNVVSVSERFTEARGREIVVTGSYEHTGWYTKHIQPQYFPANDVRDIVFQGLEGDDRFSNYTGIRSTFSDQQPGEQHIRFGLTSSSANGDPIFVNGGKIPQKYASGDVVIGATDTRLEQVPGEADRVVAVRGGERIGENKSFPLTFENAPPAAKSFVAIVRDRTGNWNHRVLFNIPEGTRGLSESEKGLDVPQGALHGTNGNGDREYSGPTARDGREHTYVTTVYALNTAQLVDPVTKQPLAAGATEEQVMKAMEPHIIGRAQIEGKFTIPSGTQSDWTPNWRPS
jgi:Raf kinase inhibitor-like YbhB/YbcL family protein